MKANDRQEGGDHYKKLGVQPWDALKAWLTPEEFRGYMKGTAIVYLARERAKGGDLDVKKAQHYLDKLMETERDDLSSPLGAFIGTFPDGSTFVVGP